MTTADNSDEVESIIAAALDDGHGDPDNERQAAAAVIDALGAAGYVVLRGVR